MWKNYDEEEDREGKVVRGGVVIKTLVRMTLLAPLSRMANTFECPCSASPPADPKLVSEETNKMSKS
jgi:hypothetical protein